MEMRLIVRAEKSFLRFLFSPQKVQPETIEQKKIP